jgi:hypothetical protein
MVGLIRDNRKVLFSMTVVGDQVVDASSGGAGGSQRAATWALGCGALAATGTNTGIGASDADWTGWKVRVFTDSGWFGTVGSPCDNGKVFFSITVGAGAVIAASSVGAGGSQRAAT